MLILDPEPINKSAILAIKGAIPYPGFREMEKDFSIRMKEKMPLILEQEKIKIPVQDRIVLLQTSDIMTAMFTQEQALFLT